MTMMLAKMTSLVILAWPARARVMDLDTCEADGGCDEMGLVQLRGVAHHVSSAAVMSNKTQVLVSTPTLKLRHTSSYEKIYADHGTGSHADVAVWRPRLFPHEFRLMYTARNNYGRPDARTVVVSKFSGEALAKPHHFVSKWNDKSTGGYKDGSFWQAVAPANYTCLSDVAVYINNHNTHPGSTRKPDDIDPKFRCVHNSLVKDTELGDLVWTDKGSGGIYDAAVWSIKGSDGMRVGRGKGDVPDFHQSTLKAFTGGLFRDLVLVTSVSNPNDFDQPAAKYTLTRGLTKTRSSSVEFSAEFGFEVSQAASIGVEGIASGSMSVTVSSKFGMSTSFGVSDTSTQASTVEVSFKVPKRTIAELYQLQVKDAQTGPGNFVIKSGQYTIMYKPL